MSEERIPLAWVPRATPLEPRAVAATGDTVHALRRRLLALDDASLAELRGVAAPGLLVVIGDAATLPWVDGVEYLGRDADAPLLLIPTALAPSVPVAALEAAVLARLRAARRAAEPVAIVRPSHLVPCGAAGPIDRARLAAGGAP